MPSNIPNPFAKMRFEVPEDYRYQLQDHCGQKKNPFVKQFDLFILAAAIGAKENKKTDIANLEMYGFAEGVYLSSAQYEMLWLISTIHDDVALADLTNARAVKTVCESYAATGLRKIHGWLNKGTLEIPEKIAKGILKEID